MAIVKKCIFILLILIINSCSSSPNQASFLSEVWFLYKNQDNEKEIIPITSDIKKAIEYPFIEIKSNGFVRQLIMIPISTRNNIINYISGDGQALTMQGALITKTNAMNNWLLSVEANPRSPFFIIKNINEWPNENIRKYKFLNAENKQTTVQVLCNIKINFKKNKIVLAQEEYNVFEVTEDCRNENQSFQNKYWVEENGFIRKSIQWVSLENTLFEVSIIKT